MRNKAHVLAREKGLPLIKAILQFRVLWKWGESSRQSADHCRWREGNKGPYPGMPQCCTTSPLEPVTKNKIKKKKEES